MNKIRWGIIGPGSIANNFADALLKTYSGELKARVPAFIITRGGSSPSAGLSIIYAVVKSQTLMVG